MTVDAAHFTAQHLGAEFFLLEGKLAPYSGRGEAFALLGDE